MANVPKYDTRNFSFGPGILYISRYDVTNDKPTFPYIDVGAVKAGASLKINRDILDVMQGAPDLIVKSFVKSESVEFTINSIEWKLDNLYTALGGGQLDTTRNIIRFGGDMDLQLYTLRFVHTTPAGDTWVIKIWKANPTGQLEINFGNDDVHQFALNFRGLKSFYGFHNYSKNLGTGNGSTTTFSGTLDNIPVVKYSVFIYEDNTLVGQDDGAGHLVGSRLSASSSINYNTGSISVVFTSAPENGKIISVKYAAYEELPQTASIVEIEKISVT